MSEYRELLLGCGHSREKFLGPLGKALQWENLTTVDSNQDCEPDWLCDLNLTPWRALPRRGGTEWEVIPENHFDEVHAYELLEHLGTQGDPFSFYGTFNEIWRVLKPGGFLFATTPSRYSPWLWGDPGHRRVIIQESLIFLDRARMKKANSARNPISDYGTLSRCDFDIFVSDDSHVLHTFVLKAIKPTRAWPF